MNDGPGRPGHERCGGRTRSGRPCKLPAGHGTDHPGIGRCDHHGGATPTHQAHARRVLAERAVEVYGLPIDVAPERALLDELARSYGHIVWLRGRIAELDPGALIWGERKRTVRQAGDGEGEVTTESGAGVHLWVQLYQAERRHLAEVAKAAMVSGAEVALADSTARLARKVADVLDFATAGLGWAERDAVMSRFAEQLGQIETAPGDADGREQT